jgi:hypothetical protein
MQDGSAQRMKEGRTEGRKDGRKEGRKEGREIINHDGNMKPDHIVGNDTNDVSVHQRL